MSAFLLAVVIVMSVALLAEIFAMIGISVVMRRATRRAGEITGQISEKVNASVRLANELKLSVQPHVQTITQDGREMGTLLTSRFRAAQVACADAGRRVERIRLRLNDSVQTVEQHRRGVIREVVEPVQAAGQVLRGIKLALWILRKVA